MLLSKLTKFQKKVCGIQTRVLDTKAHDLRKCGRNDSLIGTKGTGDGESCHKTFVE